MATASEIWQAVEEAVVMGAVCAQSVQAIEGCLDEMAKCVEPTWESSQLQPSQKDLPTNLAIVAIPTLAVDLFILLHLQE